MWAVSITWGFVSRRSRSERGTGRAADERDARPYRLRPVISGESDGTESGEDGVEVFDEDLGPGFEVIVAGLEFFAGEEGEVDDIVFV